MILGFGDSGDNPSSKGVREVQKTTRDSMERLVGARVNWSKLAVQRASSGASHRSWGRRVLRLEWVALGVN